MLKTIKIIAWIFIISFFPAEPKMCLGSMSFRATPQYQNRKNCITPLIYNQLKSFFGVDLSSWNVTFWLSFRNNWTCFVFVIGMLRFSCFLFSINFQRHRHSTCVWKMIKQSKSLQTGYVTTYIYIYIYDRYYVRTHVYVFLFSVKKRLFELSQVWPWRWPRGGYPIHGIYRPSLS